jgi:hypothetical protein
VRNAIGLQCKWSAIAGFERYDTGAPWNPLTDDGDALRLAVQLNMNIEITDGGWVYACGDYGNCSEPSGDDKSAATRRAIVRAAAEVARAKG